MLVAYNKNKERVLIRDVIESEEYFCPQCGEQLVKKNKGFKRRHHFSHKSNSVCSEHKFDKMCEWHINWQNRFPQDNIEVIKIDESGKKHIADVLINNTEIEFQHSFMPYEEFVDRNDFYNKFNYRVIWVFDGNDIFNKGYNFGPFPFSSKFDCLKKMKIVPINVDVFVEGEIKPNLFTEDGLFLHHVKCIDEKEGIIFDGKCTVSEFVNCVNNAEHFNFSKEDVAEQTDISYLGNRTYRRWKKLIDIVNQYNNANYLIVENTMTKYEVLIDKYNCDKIKQGKKAYGKIKNSYGKFLGNTVEIYYIDYDIWKFKRYY